MSAQLKIRPAQLSDSVAITELILASAHACLGDEAVAFVSTVSVANVENHLSNSQYLYVLGYLENELVAVASIREMKHVYHLFVSPTQLHKGIAKTLWHHLKTEAITYGTKQFTVNSSLYAEPVYGKFGFVPSSEPQSRNGIRYVPMQLSV